MKNYQDLKEIVDMINIMPGEIYRHCKGGRYVILGVGFNEETLELQVIYQSLTKEALIWVRPLFIFRNRFELESPSLS